MENVQVGGIESPLDFENSNEWPESLCLKGRDPNLWLCFFFFFFFIKSLPDHKPDFLGFVCVCVCVCVCVYLPD